MEVCPGEEQAGDEAGARQQKRDCTLFVLLGVVVGPANGEVNLLEQRLLVLVARAALGSGDGIETKWQLKPTA